jgi:hypothetical protein
MSRPPTLVKAGIVKINVSKIILSLLAFLINLKTLKILKVLIRVAVLTET